MLDKNPKVADFGQRVVYSFALFRGCDNYNKEKVITINKITPTTGINETAKMPLLKLFLYFTIRDRCLLIK